MLLTTDGVSQARTVGLIPKRLFLKQIKFLIYKLLQ
jgi:hypothetical protein